MRSISRLVLTALALVLLFAGSFNLNRTSAAAPAPGYCQTDCGCPGGAWLCCTIYVDNRQINCGMP